MNYWIFQYTTTVYKNAVEDFKNNKITQWEVNKHKEKIKKGDIVIIYIGGVGAKAIYGTAKIISDLIWNDSKQKYYVNIEKHEDWSLKPVSRLLAKEEIPDLLIGICGTNFKANEEQYLKLKELLYRSS
jgi:hypothetical protein